MAIYHAARRLYIIIIIIIIFFFFNSNIIISTIFIVAATPVTPSVLQHIVLPATHTYLTPEAKMYRLLR